MWVCSMDFFFSVTHVEPKILKSLIEFLEICAPMGTGIKSCSLCFFFVILLDRSTEKHTYLATTTTGSDRTDAVCLRKK